jgi:hypothetical protein
LASAFPDAWKLSRATVPAGPRERRAGEAAVIGRSAPGGPGTPGGEGPENLPTLARGSPTGSRPGQMHDLAPLAQSAEHIHDKENPWAYSPRPVTSRNSRLCRSLPGSVLYEGARPRGRECAAAGPGWATTTSSAVMVPLVASTTRPRTGLAVNVLLVACPPSNGPPARSLCPPSWIVMRPMGCHLDRELYPLLDGDLQEARPLDDRRWAGKSVVLGGAQAGRRRSRCQASASHCW